MAARAQKRHRQESDAELALTVTPKTPTASNLYGRPSAYDLLAGRSRLRTGREPGTAREKYFTERHALKSRGIETMESS